MEHRLLQQLPQGAFPAGAVATSSTQQQQNGSRLQYPGHHNHHSHNDPLLAHHDDMSLRTSGSSTGGNAPERRAAGISLQPEGQAQNASPEPSSPSRRRALCDNIDGPSSTSRTSPRSSFPLSATRTSALLPTARPIATTIEEQREGEGQRPDGQQDSEEEDLETDRDTDCDRRRSEENHHLKLPAMSSQAVGKTVTPYLKEHIPGLYAPVAKAESLSAMVPASTSSSNNSKYCYRHDPDLKCRRAADEKKMIMIQKSLERLPTADQQAITHVWSLFSAAPSKHRDLMLQGIITQCCFPQLSTVSRDVHEQLKIDFLTALPREISFKILCYLDTVSLCKAAQVSRQWRQLADDDTVWHRMCQQHIDRKCTKCGWGLPLLERKRLRDWTRQQQLAKSKYRQQKALTGLESPPPPWAPRPMSLRSPTPPKREFSSISSSSSSDEDAHPKRQCIKRTENGSNDSLDIPNGTAVEQKFRPFKDVYRDRFRIGKNWRRGNCAIKILKGHTNGVTCLQLLDNILATGSYDATIKIWNIETGEEIRTLRGHTRGVRSLQFDDNKLISGSLDRTVKIWNWHTGELLSSLQGHSDGVISVHFDGELLASGSIDTSIKIFNFETKETFCLRGHSDWVNSVRIDTESRTLLSASDDFKVKLWDLDTKACIRTFDSHTGHVQQVLPLPPDFEPDEDLLEGTDASTLLGTTAATAASMTAGESPGPVNDLRHPDHDVSSQRVAAATKAEETALRAAYGPAFETDPTRALPSRYMLSGGLDSTIRLIDTATGRCLKTFFGHFEGIWGLAGDTLRAVTAANDGMVKVWEPTSGRCERTFTGHRGPVTCVSLSDSRMASGGEDGEVRLYSFHDESGLSERGTPS